ncbi:MAG TPA: D-alanyl-D-alanine carboxypeptidase/D-alanyl-D-alanine-endopeptidase [Flavitalea sp.]|nr:D-alanyl-D-alanine carboxypeptidase/D-alanyl-D-alanine-endopeptidase [Flavitalea sp.]
MKKVYLIIACHCIYISTHAQNISARLEKQFAKLEIDTQLKHATIGFLVTDEKGNIILARNEEVGMAPASTQKIFTSIAAFDLLGKNFSYQTKLSYEGQIKNGILIGNIMISSAGDPTFGSWRWNTTSVDSILQRSLRAIKRKKIVQINGGVRIETPGFPRNGIPGGWIWDDIGNYYGAGSYGFNWKENQYDLILRSGKETGSAIKIINANPAALLNRRMENELLAAAKGTGDNAYIYFPLGATSPWMLQGTIPVGEDNFSISGASADPSADFAADLIMHSGKLFTSGAKPRNIARIEKGEILDTFFSPSLDSMNYWFMKKSINLYGEAFLKSISYLKKGVGNTGEGTEVIRDYWNERGIEKSALQILDGSGLSPQNRVTVRSLVSALNYASTKPWFDSFYNALPLINNMHMKSGSIGGARSFAGYHKSSAGTTYLFAIIVNNYSGSSSSVVRMIYEVLDVLK